MNDNKEEEMIIHKEAGLKPYFIVWALLVIFTAITVLLAYINFNKLSIIIILGIASIKSTLVLLYFMHLRHEKRLILKLIIPGTLLVLTIFIILTFLDVINR